MAMTPREMVDLFRQQRDMFGAHVETALTQSNFGWASTNLGVAYQAALMSGLIVWRHKFGSPVDDLTSAVAIARQASEELPRITTSVSNLWLVFDFGSAAIIQFLLTGASSPELLRFLPPSPPSERDLHDHVDECLGGVLARKLAGHEGNDKGDLLQKTIELVPNNKRLRLLRDSYAIYDRILDDCAAGSSIEKTV